MSRLSVLPLNEWIPQRHPLLSRWVIPALMGGYLAVFWVALLFPEADAERVSLGVMMTLAFVPAAIRGLWHTDWGAFVYALFMAGLCYLSLPYTPAGVVFLFYGQILLTQTGRWRASLILQLLMTGMAGWLGVRYGYNELIILISVLLIVVSSILDQLFFRFLQQQSDLLRSQDDVEQLARVAERERIARDLHDLLGHTLSSVRVKAELASRLLENQPERAATEITDIERLARQSLQQVRETVSGYHDGTLASEIHSARSLLGSAGVSFTARTEADSWGTADRVLAAIIREAATNIVRHAEADAACLSVTSGDGGVRLVFRDNGSGLTGGEGHGMRGIRVRVATMNGKVSWHSGDQGTELSVWLPQGETDHD